MCLDVGTDNESLRTDPLYLGRKYPRVRDERFDALVEAFVKGVQKRFPRALIQFEDFGQNNALRLLDHYRDTAFCFNDDIQGTGAVALAAVLSGLRSAGASLDDQLIVIAGAGSAGVGIAQRIRAASSKAQIWLIDSSGIVTPDRATGHQKPFARDEAGTLVEVCKRVKPGILIGVTGKGGLFTREIVETMGTDRPIILPLSNPTSASECTPEDARRWTQGRCLIATGSPFPNTSQCNNVFIFPGIGLGLMLSGATRVTDDHFTAAARAVAEMSGEFLLPSRREIRRVSAGVARALGAQDPEAAMWDPVYLKYKPAP